MDVIRMTKPQVQKGKQTHSMLSHTTSVGFYFYGDGSVIHIPLNLSTLMPGTSHGMTNKGISAGVHVSLDIPVLSRCLSI